MDRRASPEEIARLGVTVYVPPALRTYTAGQDEVHVEADDVASLLERLNAAFPGIRTRVVDETGHARPYVNVFVNEELVRGPLADARLSSGDSVHLLPSVAGGLRG
jgi:molybdopterin synthase sulfur carrier subunit